MRRPSIATAVALLCLLVATPRAQETMTLQQRNADLGNLAAMYAKTNNQTVACNGPISPDCCICRLPSVI
jgi:hypothetical protein